MFYYFPKHIFGPSNIYKFYLSALSKYCRLKSLKHGKRCSFHPHCYTNTILQNNNQIWK